MKFERFHFNEISSTNEYIKELISDFDLAVATADFQTAGRGRNGKSWEGNYGKNIYLSVGVNFKNIEAYSNPGLYQAEAALIIKNSLTQLFTGIDFRIKYPNDILAKSGNSNFKKLSGILIENSYKGNQLNDLVVGIGINCEQTEFPESINDKATSLKLLGAEPDKEIIIDSIISSYKKALSNFDADQEGAIFEKWKNELNLFDKEIKVSGDSNIWQLEKILGDSRLKLTSGELEKIIDNGDSITYDIS